MRVASKLCKSFIKYLKLLKIMYNNFTNTLIYKHFHILNTSINFHLHFFTNFCSFGINLAYPFAPKFFKCSPPPLSPIQFFFFSSNFKNYPPPFFLIIFTLFYFFSFFYKLLISPSNFLLLICSITQSISFAYCLYYYMSIHSL